MPCPQPAMVPARQLHPFALWNHDCRSNPFSGPPDRAAVAGGRGGAVESSSRACDGGPDRPVVERPGPRAGARYGSGHGGVDRARHCAGAYHVDRIRSRFCEAGGSAFSGRTRRPRRRLRPERHIRRYIERAVRRDRLEPATAQRNARSTPKAYRNGIRTCRAGRTFRAVLLRSSVACNAVADGQRHARGTGAVQSPAGTRMGIPAPVNARTYSAASASCGAASNTSAPTWASNLRKLSRNICTSFFACAS
jgi:hypothetical protein